MSKEMALTNNQEKFIIPTEDNEIPIDELDGFNLTFDKIKICPNWHNYFWEKGTHTFTCSTPCYHP